MKRPLLIITISYIIGIIIGLYCKISIVFFIIALLPIYFLIKKYIEKNRKIKNYYNLFIKEKIIILMSIIAIISNTITILLNYSYENKYKDIKEANFIAVVVSNKVQKEHSFQYKIKIETINSNKKFKNTYLLLNTNKNNNLEYGDIISFKATFKPPEKQRNYKGFAYNTYLKSIGIYGTVTVNKVQKLGSKKNNIIIEKAYKLRTKIIQDVEKNIEDENKKNLFLGILLGYDDELSKDIKNNFTTSGLSHILAVSGMHVAYILLGIQIFCKNIKIPLKLTNVLTIFILIFFIFLTGNTPSVTRACVMIILTMVANFFCRKSDTINNVCIVLLIMLINNPFSIINTGLILSFMATLGIVFLNPIIKEKIDYIFKKIIKKEVNDESICENLISKIKEIITISISAQIFIFPISIIVFNQITLSFLFANLIVSFFIGTIIILGLANIFLKIKIIYKIIEIMLNILLSISNFFSKLPISKILVITPHFFTLIIYYLVIIIFIIIKTIRKKKLKRRIEKEILTFVDNFKYILKIHIKKILVIVFIISIIFHIVGLKINNLKIHFIDVGQGDSCLLITPGEKKILVDGGGNANLDVFDVGKQTLLPYLLDRQIKRLDYVIISHFDTDHIRWSINNIKRNKGRTSSYK